jgi:hypothetical protein
MSTNTFTADDLAALDRAIAASELEVEMPGGRRVRFDSFDGLRARREYIASQLTSSTSRPTGAFRYRFTTSRGD